MPQDNRTPAQVAYMEALKNCESGGSTTVRILDTNNKHSSGLYQFQDATFLGFGKQYGLLSSTTEEAIPLIFNPDLQTAIATKMLEDHGEHHWKVCTGKLGSYPHISSSTTSLAQK